MEKFIPIWLKRSIALKVIFLVGFAITIVITVQTIISVSQAGKRMEALVTSDLSKSLNQSSTLFDSVYQQTKADAEIISSHNALLNYLDYATLNDQTGMNEEVIEIELFIRSLVNSKSHYEDIEVITPQGSIVRLENGIVIEGSVYNQALKETEFSSINDKIYFTLNYQFHIDNIISDGSYSVYIRIKNDITDQVKKLVSHLAASGIYLSISSDGELLTSYNADQFSSDDDFLEQRFTNKPLNLSFSSRISKDQAFVLINEMKSGAIYLALSAIIAISLLLFVTARIVIEKPLHDILRFIRKDAFAKDGLNKRHITKSIDEIGVFSDGLNAMLDKIQHREEALKNSEERLTLALWGGGEGMWDWNIDDKKIFFDKSSCAILKISDKGTWLPVIDWHKRIHVDDRSKLVRYTKNFFDSNESSFEIDFRLSSKSKEEIWLQVKGKRIKQINGDSVNRITGTIRNITESRKAEEKVSLYATVFDSTSNAVAILDRNFKTLAVNKAFVSITGFDINDVYNTAPSFIRENIGCSSETDHITEQLESNGHWSGEALSSRKNNDIYLQEIALNAVFDSNNHITHYICAFTDITDKKKSEDKLWLMANFDILTNLPNRSMFRDSLDNALLKAKRLKSITALLFIDLDRFKQVNDTLGHEAGDELLQQVAERLTNIVRDSDTVARLGGDEFAIILEGVNAKENVIPVVDKILKEFLQGFSVNNQNTGVGCSIGISLYPADSESADTLLRHADTAMYWSKSNGRNKYTFYEASMSDITGRRNYLEQELKTALHENQLTLFYQPQIDINTGKIIGFEALARWIHPEVGFIPPDEFITIAEDTGLISELGQMVFNQACKQLEQWHQQGHTELRMAINVSPKQFLLTDVPIDIARAIQNISVNAKYIELELTESLVMEEPEKIILMLNVLKKLGLRLSIDDFGTGYSSLSYLSQFPLDILKIDKSFINKISEDKKDLAIAQSIIAIAHSLNIKVVAEGVETIEQLEILKQFACDFVQGYYFSRPLPAEDINKLLLKNKDLYLEST